MEAIYALKRANGFSRFFTGPKNVVIAVGRLTGMILKKYLTFLLIGGLVIVSGLYLLELLSSKSTPNIVSSVVSDASDNKVAIKSPNFTKTLNTSYAFPIRNNKNVEIAKLNYLIDSAELRDEIVVKGQKATSIAGRTFLILNLRMKNDYSKAIEINTRDYIRLSINGSPEWLAPEIHNDPVAVQPLSTKYTRLGFAVNETDKNFKFQIGELNGEKSTLDLNF